MVVAQHDIPSNASPTRHPVLIETRVSGDARFLSHRDEVRMLVRAVVRAGWPLAYSQGFNPQPRLTIPMPRTVGTASDSQVAVARLCESRASDTLYATLAEQLPRGVELLRVGVPGPDRSPHPQRVTYVVELDTPIPAGVAAAREALLAADEAVVEREQGPDKPARPFDIRPYVKQIDLHERRVRLELAFESQRTARPIEVLTELGLATEAVSHRLRRVAIQWDIDLTGQPQSPTGHTRIQVGNQEKGHQEEGHQTKDHHA